MAVRLQPIRGTNRRLIPLSKDKAPDLQEKKKTCFDLSFLAHNKTCHDDIDCSESSFPNMAELNRIPTPEPPSSAIVREPRPSSPRNDNHDPRADDREALELHQIQTHEDNQLDYSSPSASSGDEYRVTTRRTISRTPTQRSRNVRKRTGLWYRFARSWTHHVTLTVPQKSNRDHFGKEHGHQSSESDTRKIRVWYW